MARNFANSSILAYYIFDEVGKNSLALDKTVTSAVTGNDTNHPTFSLVCGVQCSGWFDGLNALHYSEQHQLVAVDSCKSHALHAPTCPPDLQSLSENMAGNYAQTRSTCAMCKLALHL